MKKLLLTLGATAAIVAPVASVVACGNAKGTTPGTTPGQTPGQAGPTNQGGQTPGQTGPQNAWPISTVPQNTPPASSSVADLPKAPADEQYLSKFKVNEVTEDAYVSGFNMVAKPGTIRTFKVFDNGLFQIKFDKKLIGPGKFFASEDKAKLEAQYIAQTINIGPAVTHLEKGIQFIESSSAASLGGNLGVQIAVGNENGSADDEGLLNESSLVDHEYGHHETMWDFQNIVAGSLDKDPNDANTMGGTLVQDLIKAGYTGLPNVAKTYDPKAKVNWNWIFTTKSDLPTDYNWDVHTQHSIFPGTNYPFDGSELTTRVLNILSCRTNLSAAELYEGHAGGYVGNKRTSMDVPAAFVSDMTYRHHAHESVFGNGKDASKVSSLIDSYMKDIFGLGTSRLHLLGDRRSGKVTGINFSGFGIGTLSSLEIQDGTGTVVKTVPVSTFNSRFGFKNELLAKTWTTKHNEAVQSVDDAKVDLDINGGKTYKLIGKDKDGKEVDLSSTVLSAMSLSDNSSSWTGFNGIKVEGTHLVIGQ